MEEKILSILMEMKEEITGLKEGQNRIENRLSNVENDLSNVKSDLQELKTEVKAIKKTVDVTQDQVCEYKIKNQSELEKTKIDIALLKKVAINS